jgi:hypothetical protein
MYVRREAELGGSGYRRPIALWKSEASQRQKNSSTGAESKLNATSTRVLSTSFICEHLSSCRSGSD